jgi:hypothetical protein
LEFGDQSRRCRLNPIVSVKDQNLTDLSLRRRI